MVQKRKVVIRNVLFIMLSLFLFLNIFIGFNARFVFADSTSNYSNVLDDLQKDENFNIENYTQNVLDYSLQVVQIAESSAKELFIYVFQPCTSLTLISTSINISTGINDNLHYKNYKMQLLNNKNQFFKYLVKDFEVKPDALRYYDISSIFRAWDKIIDKDIKDKNGNTITEVSYKVGLLYTASTVEDKVSYTCLGTEVLTIEDKYVGFMRYSDGNFWHLWGEGACDRHFIAFSTDRKIDKLIKADVYYRKQTVDNIVDTSGIIFKRSWNYGKIDDGYAYLSYTQKGEYVNNHFTYSWDRIESIDEFKKGVNISDTYSCGIFGVDYITKITEEGMRDLEGKQWVLSFLETEYSVLRSLHQESYHSTRVSDVTILRLEFEADGVVYNLGVVDNKQTGDSIPDNEQYIGFKGLIKLLIFILVGILAVVVLIPLMPLILRGLIWLIKFLFLAIKYILLALWWLVSLPFKLIFGSK